LFGAFANYLTAATSAVVSIDLGFRSQGTDLLVTQSRFSRKIIRVRKVVRTRFFVSSGMRRLPVATQASFIADMATYSETGRITFREARDTSSQDFRFDFPADRERTSDPVSM
jgi:hypothetical protein